MAMATSDHADIPSTQAVDIFTPSVNPFMRSVERAAADVASTNLPIFIKGESGTGKGALAAMIHRMSRRAAYDFVTVNCRSVKNVVGSAMRRPSLGLKGHQLKGTVLLDDVLHLDPALHADVMNMLPEASPDDTTTPRILAATRSEEATLPLDSTFSRELYYRLRGVILRIPPLRDRREDIPLLADFLLKKHAPMFGRSNIQLSWRAETQFQSYRWPGNVRELENAIKMLLAVNDEDLVLEAIGLAIVPTAQPNGHENRITAADCTVSLKEASRIASRIAEKQLIREVLTRTQWNRKRAAKQLNISYKALLYKLKQTGLNQPEIGEVGSGELKVK